MSGGPLKGWLHEDVRRQKRASARPDALELERARRRLQHLYDVSQLLTRHVESIERTFDELMTLVSDVVPLTLVVLLRKPCPHRGVPSAPIVWHAQPLPKERVRGAIARAQRAFRYLARAPAPAPGEEVAAALEISPFVVLPLIVERGEVFGALHLEGSVRLDEEHLNFVNAVVNQLAVALDRTAIVRARQNEAETKRAAAEKSADDQRFLASISALLASSLQVRETVGAVARATVPRIADACLFDEVTDDEVAHEVRLERVEVVVAEGSPLQLVELLRQRVGGVQADVVASGAAVLVGDLAVRHPAAHADAEGVPDLGVHSMMVVPLSARGRTLGTLTFLTLASGRCFTASDLALAEEIGRRAGVAIDNAQLYERAQHAVRAREDLLAVVAHDLRNPVGTLLLNANLLLRELTTESSRRRVEIIKRGAAHMKRLIADLLDVSSMEAGHLAVQKGSHLLQPLVEEALEGLETSAGQKNVRLDTALPIAAFEVDCDRERVLQVLGNLIGNAIKFTPAGGSVQVRVEPRADEVLFAVADSGPGLAEDERPRVFDRYWQAKHTARLGTGLGLAIAKGLVEAHAGRIWVESEPGRGATFFFTIAQGQRAGSRPAC